MPLIGAEAAAASAVMLLATAITSSYLADWLGLTIAPFAILIVSIAAAVFFFVVKPVNYVTSRRRAGEEVVPDTKQCPECLSSIPLGARRCAFCTSVVAA